MNVSELIELLNSMVEDGVVSGETPVRLMYQPNYPLVGEVAGLATEQQIQWADDTDEDTRHPDPVAQLNIINSTPNVLYLLEGGHVGYGNKTAWEFCD